MKQPALKLPRLIVKSEGEQVSRFVLSLTKGRKKVIRLTGGCGYMSSDDAEKMTGIFLPAFSRYSGIMLFGGARMVRNDSGETVMGITEVPIIARKHNESLVPVGIVAKTSDLRLSPYGIVISVNDMDDYQTIIHPEQDQCLVVQKSANDHSQWDAEYKESISIISDLRSYGGFSSVLISYNGGQTTAKEIEATAKLGWPVVLIAGSGRATDGFAQDKEFLEAYPNVIVVSNNSELEKVLESLGII